MNKKTFIYVIEESGNGYVKIGISNEPSRRLADMQTGSPYDLTLLLVLEVEDAAVTESFLHEVLEKFRIRGEWFDGSCLNDPIFSMYEKKQVDQYSPSTNIRPIGTKNFGGLSFNGIEQSWDKIDWSEIEDA